LLSNESLVELELGTFRWVTDFFDWQFVKSSPRLKNRAAKSLKRSKGVFILDDFKLKEVVHHDKEHRKGDNEIESSAIKEAYQSPFHRT